MKTFSVNMDSVSYQRRALKNLKFPPQYRQRCFTELQTSELNKNIEAFNAAKTAAEDTRQLPLRQFIAGYQKACPMCGNPVAMVVFNVGWLALENEISDLYPWAYASLGVIKDCNPPKDLELLTEIIRLQRRLAKYLKTEPTRG